MADQLGFQGGDKRHLLPGNYLDLSTCVNRYGPPDSVINTIKTLKAEVIRLHPYEASDQFSAAYSKYLGVSQNDILSGRGTTEFIWSLARTIDHAHVLVPLPAYTDFMRAFPKQGKKPYQTPFFINSIEHLAQCMKIAKWVVISNPNNPTGKYFSHQQLYELCKTYPATTLVIDESYIDFNVKTNHETLIGSDIDNVVILRSPSKFFGIAGVRAGIAWTKNTRLLQQLKGQQDTWPLSALDALIASQVLKEEQWINKTRIALKEDALWLETNLRKTFNHLVTPVPVHYRFLFTKQASLIAEYLQANNILIRYLSEAHGIVPDGIRITAPLIHEREQLASALEKLKTILT